MTDLPDQPDGVHPTDGEIDILRVLWQRGEASVREVHEALAAGRGIATVYTTTLKLMQIMTEKGLVTRRADGRAHRYRAAVAQEAAQRSILGGVLHRLFDGSARRLVLQAIDLDRISADELAEIRQAIEQASARERTAGRAQPRARKERP